MQRVTVSIVLFFGFLHVAAANILLRGRHVVDEDSSCANSQCIGEPSTQSHIDSKRDSTSYHTTREIADTKNWLSLFESTYAEPGSWGEEFWYWTTQPADNNWIAVWKADDTNAPRGDDYVAWAYAPGNTLSISIPGFRPEPGAYKAYLLQWANRQTPLSGPFEFDVPKPSLTMWREYGKLYYIMDRQAKSNWIGIWKADDTNAPRGDNYVARVPATGKRGAVYMAELGVKPGIYKAYLLQEGNEDFPLAGPVDVNVPKSLIHKDSFESSLEYSTVYPARGNWIGVWKADDASAPTRDNYVKWGHAPDFYGEMDISELQSQPGTYKAYLFQWGNRKTPLAGPTEFNVTARPPRGPSGSTAVCKTVITRLAIAMGVGTTLRGGPAITLPIVPEMKTCPQIGGVKPVPIAGQYENKCEYSLPRGGAQMTGTLSWVEELANGGLGRAYDQIREEGLNLGVFDGCADPTDFLFSENVAIVNRGDTDSPLLGLEGTGNMKPEWCLDSDGTASHGSGWFCTLSSLMDEDD